MRKLLPFIISLLGFAHLISGQSDGSDKAVSLGGALNSTADELAPVLSADGQTLYFIRDGHPQNMGTDNQPDIWISYRQSDGTWSRAVNAGTTLNDRRVNQVVSVSPSGRCLYLTMREGNVVTPLSSCKEKRTWGAPRAIELPAGYQPQSLYLSNDGRVLLFSARDGGFSLDLFVTFRSPDGGWQSAINLGPVINTAADERSVLLAADGLTLYFSSNGHPGMGGQDWWVSRRLDDSWTHWTAPLSLGQKVNTPDDDGAIAVTPSGEGVIFSKKNGPSGFDLYQAVLPEELRSRPVELVKGRINTGSATTGARIAMQSLGNTTVFQQLEIDAEGRYALLLPVGSEVGLFAGAEGFIPVSEYIGTAGRQQEELDDAQNMLAARDVDPSYFRRETELQSLQVHLRRLDDELRQLNTEREKYLKALKDNYPTEIFADPELEALRHRFNNFVYRDTSREDKLRAKGPDAYEDSGEDLEEMKQKYRDYFSEADERKKRTEGGYLWEEDAYLAPEKNDKSADLDMVGEAVRDLATNLSPEEQRLLRRKEAELRESIRKGLAAPGREQPAAPSSRSAEWEMKLEEDVLFQAGEKVAPAAFKEDLKKALRGDLAYSTKKERQEELRREYEEKLQRQLAVEEKLVAKGVPVAMEEPKAEFSRKSQQKDLELSPLRPGAVIPLNNIFFEVNTADFKASSEAELDRIVAFLRQNANLAVEVGAHTHGWMTHTQATSLSEQRAAAVANYLILHGISSGRIEYRGYGKTQPVTTNETEAGRRQNQRIEMKILR